MRKTIIIAATVLCWPAFARAQDSLQTVLLQEVVTTGTKFEIDTEKSGKTIYRLGPEDLEQRSGKSLADVLNEIPGIQMDGNFGTPGSNISYYLRGGRNKNTLVLIDGVPLNDPSGINAEYDLRYIPLAQIESIEVLNGGLSTLYGTGAAAGVINIKLKKATQSPVSGSIDLNAGSFGTFGQNLRAGGTTKAFSYNVLANHLNSDGFSAAEQTDPGTTYDKDGFKRSNALLDLGYKFSGKFRMNAQVAAEMFDADYDAFEFTDAASSQEYDQVRFGLTPSYQYNKGELQGRFFYNKNERVFRSDFPASYEGRNFQSEIVHRHHFSNAVQTLVGLNYQHMAYGQENTNAIDTTSIYTLDPYASLLIDLPVGLTVHAGVRLNTHSEYGSKVVYNVNPSYLINRDGDWRVKLSASLSTSYITPSLYQLYSFYGNPALVPEEATNYEAGVTLYGSDAFTFSATWFLRNESQPIDFVSIFDNEGNYLGGQYQNLTSKREVKGIELFATARLGKVVSVSANYTHLDTDKPESFYRIPFDKYGISVSATPLPHGTVSLRYSHTGDRTIFDFNSFSEITLRHYDLVDLYASYGLFNNKLTLYGSVNNLLDEQFVAIFGYTTRGRNYNIGVRYSFGK